MNRLRELRKSKKMTQEDLAHFLNVQRVSVSKYENGNVPLTDDNLLRLSKIFDVSIDYILCRTDDPTPPLGKKERPVKQERDALEVYKRLVELNDGEELTQNQKDALLGFIEHNSDYVKFVINKAK